MSKYTVYRTVHFSVEVEAADMNEAIDIAQDIPDSDWDDIDEDKMTAELCWPDED